MNSKPIAAVAALAAATMALAGCGSGTASGSGSGPVTIKYISSTILEAPEKTFEQKAIDEFNAKHSDIKVQVEGVAANDLMEKYTALASSNQMPDFYMADMKNTTRLVDMGVAEDVRKVFDDGYLKSFDKDALNGYAIDGVPSAIPWFTVAQGIVYRTDMFKKAGIAKTPTTWDEMVQDAKKITNGNQFGVTLVGSKDASGAGRFQYVIRNFGVNEFTKDSSGKWSTDIGGDDFEKALDDFTGLDVKDHVVPSGVTETNYPAAVNLLSSGQAAMLITGSNAVGAITSKVPDLKGKLGSFPIPKVKRSVFSQNGFGFFVNPKSEHKKQVAEFIEYMVGAKKQVEFSQLTGRLPTITKAANDGSIGKDEALKGFMTALHQADTTIILPTIPGYDKVNDIYGEAYQSVFTGAATPEQASAKAKEAAQAIVDEANK